MRLQERIESISLDIPMPRSARDASAWRRLDLGVISSGFSTRPGLARPPPGNDVIIKPLA